MNIVKQWLAISALAGLLMACSPFGTSNLPEPSPLPAYQPQLALSTEWTDNVGGIGDDYFDYALSAHGNTLYTVNKNGLLVATDIKNHSRLWRVFADKTITSGPAYAQDMIVFTTIDGAVYAIDAKTGKQRWQAQLPNQVLGKPTIYAGDVFVKTIDDQVFALNTGNGKIDWSYTRDAPELVLRSGASPLVFGNRVLVGLSSGYLVALDRRNGRLLWQQAVTTPKGSYDVERMVDITITPVVVDGVVYVASYQGHIAAYNLASGKRLWQRNISAYSGIAANQNALFITDASGNLWAFDRNNGQVKWRQSVLAHRGLTAPVLMGNNIIVGDKLGYLHWLTQAEGKIVARAQLTDSGALISTPLVIDNTVYALASDGRLQAISAK